MTAHRILITGASGFLGREIVRQIGGKYSVFATGQRPKLDVTSKADYVPVNLLADDLGVRLPGNIDTIVHAAGVTGRGAQSLTQNLDMTRGVIEWGAEVGARNAVLISSAAVYADSIGSRLETSACEPQSAYGQSKLASEQYAIAECANAGMRLVILRKPALIGPTRHGNVARLIKTLRRNRFVLLGSGSNQKSLVSVHDAARACLATLDYLENKRPEKAHSIFNVSGGTMSMMEIIDAICQELGRSRPPRVPAPLATVPLKALSAISLGAGPFGRLLATVEQFLREDVLDASLFHEAVGFDAAVDLHQALREMVQHQSTDQ